jgi:hypothetical protein
MKKPKTRFTVPQVKLLCRIKQCQVEARHCVLRTTTEKLVAIRLQAMGCLTFEKLTYPQGRRIVYLTERGRFVADEQGYRSVKIHHRLTFDTEKLEYYDGLKAFA